MLAIHNNVTFICQRFLVANAFAKLSKCQQFTPRLQDMSRILKLQTLLQSYQNVSNSQRRVVAFQYLSCCKRFCKVIKMLAIHNNFKFVIEFSKAANAFAKLSKCQQFTTNPSYCFSASQLQTLLQSYQNVSNSQHIIDITNNVDSCKRFCKVIKMLAIHNRDSAIINLILAANAFAKLSKCQQFTTDMKEII